MFDFKICVRRVLWKPMTTLVSHNFLLRSTITAFESLVLTAVAVFVIELSESLKNHLNIPVYRGRKKNCQTPAISNKPKIQTHDSHIHTRAPTIRNKEKNMKIECGQENIRFKPNEFFSRCSLSCFGSPLPFNIWHSFEIYWMVAWNRRKSK